MIEGGTRLVELMGKMEAGEVTLTETADGGMQINFRAPQRRRRASAGEADT